jgi:RNA polymerase sigma-70 factor (ECF subfamily)
MPLTEARAHMTDLDAHLEALRAGDAEAFALWLAGAERPVRASLRRFAPHVDTEAVLQEALLRAWQVAPRFHPDGAPNALLRFTLRAAHHLALSEARRLRPSLLPDEALLRAADTAADARPSEGPDPLLRAAILRCQEKLPGAPARALGARLLGAGRPDAALAEGLGMRPNTFLQNVTRARAFLARCLEKAGVRLAEVL